MEKKYKPFDLEEAKKGKPVCTRDGREARIVCFDRKYLCEKQDYPIVALIKEGPYDETIDSYTKDGLYYSNAIHNNDLMMLPEKKEGWVNLYKSSAHSTKEEAMKYRNKCDDYIDTIKVEWEE